MLAKVSTSSWLGLAIREIKRRRRGANREIWGKSLSSPCDYRASLLGEDGYSSPTALSGEFSLYSGCWERGETVVSGTRVGAISNTSSSWYSARVLTEKLPVHQSPDHSEGAVPSTAGEFTVNREQIVVGWQRALRNASGMFSLFFLINKVLIYFTLIDWASRDPPNQY